MSSPPTVARKVKWWGWGIESKTYPLDDKPKFWPYLRKTLTLGELGKCPRVELEDIKLSPPRGSAFGSAVSLFILAGLSMP